MNLFLLVKKMLKIFEEYLLRELTEKNGPNDMNVVIEKREYGEDSKCLIETKRNINISSTENKEVVVNLLNDLV